jgi:3-deoxy-D-manno-octulosonate 8-phosphate phosphatase (KDO 8-P phosphatase)
LNFEVQAGLRGFPSREAYRAIKLIVLDVDGVLTDARIVIDSTGVETKFFDVRDGASITFLMKAEFKVGLLTGRSSPVVDFRAKELHIPPEMVRQGAIVKLPVFMKLLSENGVTPAETLYIGDDIIDLPVLEVAGLACCPADAHPEVKKLCHVISPNRGGRGGVRAIIEHFLKTRADGTWEKSINRYLGKA